MSIDQAKNFLVKYQGLDNSIEQEGKQGILEYFQKIGSIQYDPLNIVGRNPDLVLQSRIKNYEPYMLEELLYKDRSLVDGWDKMMSIYQANEWSFFNKMRQIKEKSAISILKYRNALEALDYCDKVISILKKKGPLQSTKIDFGETKKGSWGHGRIAGATLDYLFHKGDVGIFKKKGTQKIYDLIENILSKEILEQDEPFLNERSFHKWLLKRRIDAIGLYWNKNSIVWEGVDSKFNSSAYRESLISELIEENELKEVKIEGLSYVFYMNSKNKYTEDFESSGHKYVKMIAPLDNLLWDRTFIEKLFYFNYRWEVYTPVKKRKYGYYVLPVLYGTEFIGRFEPVIDKEKKELVIKNWWWEENVKKTKKLKDEIQISLNHFLGFLNLQRYRDDSGAGL